MSATVQFVRKARQAQADLGIYNALLARVTQVIARAEGLMVSGAVASKGPAERQALSLEVDHMLEDLVATTNSRSDLRYVLGGRETMTPPLSVTRDAAGRVTAAAWNPRGDSEAIIVEISEGVSVQTNLPGSAVLGADTDATFTPAVLIALHDSLAANDGEAVRDAIDDLHDTAARLAGPRAAAGGGWP